MEIKTIFFALCCILYGILKISLGISLSILPEYIIDKIPILKYFNDKNFDKTLAGRFYNYILVVYGFYTILAGFALLKMFSPNINYFFENKEFIYTLYSVLGITILIFYLLVLYTNVPISKNLDEYKNNYEIICYVGTLSFLALPIFWNYMTYMHPIYKNMSNDMKYIILIGFTIFLSIIYEIIYKIFNKNKINKINKINKNTKSNIVLE
jgi:hypothetical protein